MGSPDILYQGTKQHMKGEQHHYPIAKKDESLRNFHWCLIRTLHNYPFLTDGKSNNNFPLNELAGNQHKKLDLIS